MNLEFDWNKEPRKNTSDFSLCGRDWQLRIIQLKGVERC